jgi:hypothetical protein
MAETWSVCVLGEKDGEHEVSVVNDSFEHGKVSCGWFDPFKKIEITSGEVASEFDDQEWEDILRMAQTIANALSTFK